MSQRSAPENLHNCSVELKRKKFHQNFTSVFLFQSAQFSQRRKSLRQRQESDYPPGVKNVRKFPLQYAPRLEVVSSFARAFLTQKNCTKGAQCCEKHNRGFCSEYFNWNANIVCRSLDNSHEMWRRVFVAAWRFLRFENNQRLKTIHEVIDIQCRPNLRLKGLWKSQTIVRY